MTSTATVATVDDLSVSMSTAPGRPQRILLADEDAASLAGLVEAVAGPERELHSTLCGDLALELALQLHFDLLVLHVNRPGAAGVDITRTVRACRALDQPTIVIIGGAEDEGAGAAQLDAGADRVLSAPRSAVDVSHALGDLLR